jgi:hypothetical protein
LAGLHNAIFVEGKTLPSIQEEYFGSYIKYHRGIEKVFASRQRIRSWEVNVIVYWGPTGTGKTRRAFQSEPAPSWIYSSDGWFDGYAGDEVVLFDDFGGHEFKITYLLKLLDRYPMRVRVKGSFVQWAPKTIYITSNINPEEWYPNARRLHKEALMRRITEIHHMDRDYFAEPGEVSEEDEPVDLSCFQASDEVIDLTQ